MDNVQILRAPLRVWPGAVAAAAMLLLRFVLPEVVPESGMVAMIGSMLCALAVLVWWLFFSRAPVADRWAVVALTIATLGVTRFLLDKSIAGGMMGMMYFFYAVPAVALALAVSATLVRQLSGTARRAAIAAAIVIAAGGWTLLRTDGMTGEGSSQFAWRWTETAEARLVAKSIEPPAVLPEPSRLPPAPEKTLVPAARVEPQVVKPAREYPTPEWPGFRGPRRDGVVRNVRIATDWSASPPVEEWRRPVGPAWSSFAVAGDLLYTREQRGDHELVSCYRAATGQPVWTHKDAARFWESNAGAGPRGTPAVSEGRVYALGATGILNALDARTGAVLWSRNAADDTGAKLPGWGFSASPLVAADLVVVATGGRLAAYDTATGKLRWKYDGKGGSYSSPHLLTVGGVDHILMLTGAGATGLTIPEGKPLWQYPWQGSPILQPAVAQDGEILITTGDMSGGVGIRRIGIRHDAGWTIQERWTSSGLKPYFSDFVVHEGHAYGFDGRILSSIDLNDGKRKWKGGRYGAGQLVLLPDQDLLLVLSETGEIALVSAKPDEFREVARFQAIEGKT